MQNLQPSLLKSILQHGDTYSKGHRADPSECESLREAGVGMVTAHIEQLTLAGLVTDPFPILGVNGGMWIGYQLTDRARDITKSPETLNRECGALCGGPRHTVSEEVLKLRDECIACEINDDYREDFLRTLEEIQICFDAGCYNATLGLCGKIVEVCLKEALIRNSVSFDPNNMIGALIKLMREQVPHEYVDDALGNIVNVVNSSRITAVHAKGRIPVPSRDQTVMVISAMQDVVRRNNSRKVSK